MKIISKNLASFSLNILKRLNLVELKSDDYSSCLYPSNDGNGLKNYAFGIRG